MAPAKTAEKDDLASLLGVSVEDVNPETTRIQNARGRQKGADVLQLQQVLRECVKNNTAKVFTIDIEDEAERIKKRNSLISKVRSAAAKGNEDLTDLDVGTSWDGTNRRLYFGPQAAIDKMMGRKPKS